MESEKMTFLKKFYFLDWDGTLADSLSNLRTAYDDFLDSHGFQGSDEEFHSINGPSWNEIAAYLKEKYKLKDSVDQIHKNYQKILISHYSNSALMPGAKEFLELLKNMKVTTCLVSSNSPALCDILLEKYEMKNKFDFFVWGDDVKVSKPNPEIYQMAVRKAHAKPEESIVIEDSVNGVLSASRAHLDVYGVVSEVQSGQSLIHSGAQKVFSSLYELIDEIRN
jgi:beta-phosphoglucomutase